MWQSFIVEGAKLISAADTWVQISEIPGFPPWEEWRKDVSVDRMCELFKYGLESLFDWNDKG